MALFNDIIGFQTVQIWLSLSQVIDQVWYVICDPIETRKVRLIQNLEFNQM